MVNIQDLHFQHDDHVDEVPLDAHEEDIEVEQEWEVEYVSGRNSMHFV